MRPPVAFIAGVSSYPNFSTSNATRAVLSSGLEIKISELGGVTDMIAIGRSVNEQPIHPGKGTQGRVSKANVSGERASRLSSGF
jgi:hypothetical protein